eukprot:6199157-Pleurochrysis_carterae.AAC.5
MQLVRVGLDPETTAIENRGYSKESVHAATVGVRTCLQYTQNLPERHVFCQRQVKSKSKAPVLRRQRREYLVQSGHAVVPELLTLPDALQEVLSVEKRGEKSDDIGRPEEALLQNALHELDCLVPCSPFAVVGEHFEGLRRVLLGRARQCVRRQLALAGRMSSLKVCLGGAQLVLGDAGRAVQLFHSLPLQPQLLLRRVSACLSILQGQLDFAHGLDTYIKGNISSSCMPDGTDVTKRTYLTLYGAMRYSPDPRNLLALCQICKCLRHLAVNVACQQDHLLSAA